MTTFSALPREVREAMATPMHLILPPSSPTGALYLGSLAATIEPTLLTENYITHIVQVLELPWASTLDENSLPIETYFVDLKDEPTVDLMPHLKDACDDIRAARTAGKNVLVHCHQGVSRSASIIIAYLMRDQDMSYDSAYSFAKARRACVEPNVGFVQALRVWEGQISRSSELRGEGAKAIEGPKY